jgi:class 3 adenylate cyclase
MIACPSCGFEAADGSAFCAKCGAKLAAPSSAPEERKVVTTLICDLVSFTALSEAADAEDVDALLAEYFARATKVIESHGGIVEKFIGDAVVGVFGVPAAHEDDPQRAVHAALRLVQAFEGLAAPDGSPLQVRIGVNTGEALVRLDIDPLSGRGFLTGDAVNAAARLQAAAPPGGVVVGQSTFALAGRAFACEELAPIAAKGKSEPLARWLAVAPLARPGSVAE